MRVDERQHSGRKAFSISALLVWLLACAWSPRTPAAAHPGTPPQRIISLSPATTEILFTLGLGPKIVGITRYCDYPAETASISRVGGYVDPNYEVITALKPDLVIVLTSHRDLTVALEKLHIRTLVTPHETIADVHEAIRLIGDACGVPEQAVQLNSVLAKHVTAVQQAVKNLPAPTVLMCIARDFNSGQLTGMYMAGNDGFYDAIIRMAGGTNACTDSTAAFPLMSAESVITLNPDVIVDLTGVFEPGTFPPDGIARQWDRLDTVAAVRNRRVYTIGGTHALRPGPRYVDFLAQFARLLHPAAFPAEAPHE